MALRQLPSDFRRRYGYRPALMESFVDRQRHAGTCFRAANFLRPLRRDFRAVLGAAAPPPEQALGPAEGLALDQFAHN